MSAGLDASTVTPGITPPELSCTTPAIALVPCALARLDAKSTQAQTAVARSVKATKPDSGRDTARPRAFVVLPNLKALIVSPLRSHTHVSLALTHTRFKSGSPRSRQCPPENLRG